MIVTSAGGCRSLLIILLLAWLRTICVLLLTTMFAWKPNSITLSGSNQLRTSTEPAPNQPTSVMGFGFKRLVNVYSVLVHRTRLLNYTINAYRRSAKFCVNPALFCIYLCRLLTGVMFRPPIVCLFVCLLVNRITKKLKGQFSKFR